MDFSNQSINPAIVLSENKSVKIESTFATVVYPPSTLYNVQGSTYDPKHIPGASGYSWKQLLIYYGIGVPGNADDCCFAISPPAPGGSTHPQFLVGGHMTTSSNGVVPVGGICYLMPLCKWHNSTNRDGIPFTPLHKPILELYGYMQAEPAALFKMRLPSEERFAVIRIKDGSWISENLSENSMNLFEARSKNKAADADDHYFLFERDKEDNSLTLVNQGGVKDLSEL